MANYETEDQQLEDLKKWWQENGRAILVGVLLGVGGVVGWQAWVKYDNTHREQASTLYEAAMTALFENDTATLKSKGEVLLQDYADTAYAEMIALALARVAVDAGDLATAANHLRWAQENARQENIGYIAGLRLAQVLIEQGEYSAADALLKQSYPESYTAQREEILGDLHFAKGETDAAREAYQRALTAAEAAGEGDRRLLEMKLNDLAVVEPEPAPAS